MLLPLTLAAEPESVALLAVGMLGLVWLVAVVYTWRNRMERARHREQLQREIAAYVAEGSMTAEEGERLIKASVEECKHAPWEACKNAKG